MAQALTDARAAKVTMQWNPTYDDGSTSSTGAHAGYDVRWTTTSVPSNNAMATSDDYFGVYSYTDSSSAWSAAQITRELELPPLNTYYIAVRARDEVGNYSAFTAPTAIANWWTTATLSAPIASTTFGYVVTSIPSINNDSIPDLVVTAPTRKTDTISHGAAYIYYGSNGFASQAACGAGCQELLPADVASTGQFGLDAAGGGNVGDVAGEAKPDLIIGQGNSSGGRAVLYFGTASAATISTATSIEFRYTGTSSNRLGDTVKIIADMNNDGLSEVAFGLPNYNGGLANQGAVVIYYGRSQADWLTLYSGGFIPVPTGADDMIVGPNPLLEAAGNRFGRNTSGLVSLTDMNSDGVPELAVPMSISAINQYRIFSGVDVVASTVAAPLEAASYALNLTQATTTDTNNTNGFGAAAVASVDIVDSTAHDLVVSYPLVGYLQLYSGVTIGTTGPVQTIAGPASMGERVSGGRVNSDTRIDLLAGMGSTSGAAAWLLYQRASGTAFEGSFGTAAAFHVTKFNSQELTGSATSRLGRSNTLGDVDGDTLADVILADTTTGQVRIWR